MLTPIEQMAASFHAAPDQGLPEHVRAAGDCEPYQPWAVAHMHIAHNVSTVFVLETGYVSKVPVSLMFILVYL